MQRWDSASLPSPPATADSWYRDRAGERGGLIASWEAAGAPLSVGLGQCWQALTRQLCLVQWFSVSCTLSVAFLHTFSLTLTFSWSLREVKAPSLCPYIIMKRGYEDGIDSKTVTKQTLLYIVPCLYKTTLLCVVIHLYKILQKTGHCLFVRLVFMGEGVRMKPECLH